MLRWNWAAWLVAVMLCACGGGGGGGGSGSSSSAGNSNGNGNSGSTSTSGTPATRTPLAALSQDVNPAGARLDYRDRNYFPAAAGDSWTYDRQQNGASTGQAPVRKVESASGAEAVVAETSLGTTTRETLRRTSEGIVSVLPLADEAPAAVSRAVGDVIEYPEPFYPVGATRRVIRQGDWGSDVDGDGVSETFRVELSQVLVGLETVSLPSGSLKDVAHFRNVTVLMLQPSDPKRPVTAVTGTEDLWWAPGVGLVRAERSAVDSTGAVVEPAYTLVLTGGSVGGKTLFALSPTETTLTKIALAHNALVFDRTRGRYYASVPGSVIGNGNRIAVIDAATGALGYSAATVGSEPGALALSAGDEALYVGLNGTGDVVKLRLPDLAVQWRARLPVSGYGFGQQFAERIAVSPRDADVVAVSMYRVGISPRHGGVALIRAGVVQPVMTQDHTGSNLIAFDGDGRYVYGFNNETTEFGLRRIAVLADGLRQEQVVAASGNFSTRTLDWSANGLVLEKAVYRAPDLTLLGRAGVQGGGCRPHTVPNRLLCAYNSPYDSTLDGALAMVDAGTFVVLAAPVYQRGQGGATLSEIVPGPAGQAALRMNATYSSSPSDSVWLFTSPALK